MLRAICVLSDELRADVKRRRASMKCRGMLLGTWLSCLSEASISLWGGTVALSDYSRLSRY